MKISSEETLQSFKVKRVEKLGHSWKRMRAETKFLIFFPKMGEICVLMGMILVEVENC